MFISLCLFKKCFITLVSALFSIFIKFKNLVLPCLLNLWFRCLKFFVFGIQVIKKWKLVYVLIFAVKHKRCKFWHLCKLLCTDNRLLSVSSAIFYSFISAPFRHLFKHCKIVWWKANMNTNIIKNRGGLAFTIKVIKLPCALKHNHTTNTTFSSSREQLWKIRKGKSKWAQLLKNYIHSDRKCAAAGSGKRKIVGNDLLNNHSAHYIFRRCFIRNNDKYCDLFIGLESRDIKCIFSSGKKFYKPLWTSKLRKTGFSYGTNTVTCIIRSVYICGKVVLSKRIIRKIFVQRLQMS